MNQAHKQFFETAYRTGSDIWSHLPYQKTALQMTPHLPQDSLILDVGSGRGLWVQKLVQMGYRLIGIDYVQLIVDRANDRIKSEGIQNRARFMVGDVCDIPLANESFDMATDIGLLQHLDPEDWKTYVNEIHRVLKKDGCFLNVSLSRHTTQFMGLHPRRENHGDFEKFGLHYYFFTEEELDTLFSKKFIKIEQRIRYFDTRNDPEDGIALIFTLLQKK
jgi:ubiquinone/menaquinone biosynthesis C-methylase UbiE